MAKKNVTCSLNRIIQWIYGLFGILFRFGRSTGTWKMTKLIFKINRFEIKLRTVEFIHFAFGLCRNKTRIGLSRTNWPMIWQYDKTSRSSVLYHDYTTLHFTYHRTFYFRLRGNSFYNILKVMSGNAFSHAPFQKNMIPRVSFIHRSRFYVIHFEFISK